MKKYTIVCSIILFQAAYVLGQTKTTDKTTQQQKTGTTQSQEKNNQPQTQSRNTQSVVNNKISDQLQTYDNFDGTKVIYYAAKTGTLDTLSENPANGNITDKNTLGNSKNNMGNTTVTGSGKCGKYVRDSKQKYDYIKMNLTGKLTDVNPFTTYSGITPKIKMKVYTTAPAGTLIEVQLGKKSNSAYPGGINSQYQAYTTVSNAWEEIEFKFSQIPQGSKTSTTDVDQITLMFNPNSSTSDTYYFDDIMGPALISDKSVSVD